MTAGDYGEESAYLQILQKLEAIVWKADALTLRVSFVNASGVDVLGYSEEDWRASPDFLPNAIAPTDRERVIALFRASVADGKVRRCLHRMLTADGRTVWFHTEIHPVDEGGGRVSSFVGLSIEMSERMRALETLKEEKTRERLLIEQVPVVLWTTNKEPRFTTSAGAGLSPLGLGPELVVGTSLYEYFQTDDPNDPNIAPTLRALAGEATTYDTKWGDRFFQVHVEPFHDRDGTLLGTIGVGIDITERKQAEVELYRSKQQFEDLVNSIDGIVWQCDPISFEFSFVSPRAEELLGYPISCWLTDPNFWASRIHPEDCKSALDYCKTETRKLRDHEFEYRMIAADGHVVWLRDVVSVISEEGRPVLLRGVMIDITKLKQAEAERDRLLAQEKEARELAERAESRAVFLAEASRLLSTSLDYQSTLEKVARLAVPYLADWCTVCMLDEEGAIHPMVLAHTDSKMEALAKDAPDCGVDPRWSDGISYAIRSGRPILRYGRGDLNGAIDEDLVMSIGARDPARLDLIRLFGLSSYIVAPLIVRDRKLGAMFFARTSHERRFCAADLVLAEDLAHRAAMAVDNALLYRKSQEAIVARDEFLSIASHELRTPCTSLMLGIQSLLRYTKGGEKKAPSPAFTARILETADRQSRKLAVLIDRLLDVSRIRSGRLQLELDEVDLGALVSEVSSELRGELKSSGSALSLRMVEGVIGRWDRSRIEQVVTNLLSNAIKYGEGKPIEVCIELSPPVVRLIIRDQGIGIDVEHQTQIFERFERAVSAKHYGGLGLGLYICREIVEAHGGRIKVVSAPGQGSTFIVELPLAGPRAALAAHEPAPSIERNALK